MFITCLDIAVKNNNTGLDIVSRNIYHTCLDIALKIDNRQVLALYTNR